MQNRRMVWVGGKGRGADRICRLLNDPQFDGMPYLEPFTGMCHVLMRVENKSSYSASDSCRLLVILLRAVQAGREIPRITRERYTLLKKTMRDSLEKAVAGITFSFNGKLWGGYTELYTRKNGKVDDMFLSRKRHYERLKQSPSFMSASLACRDYRSHSPHGCVVFCDPPYAGTTGYYGSKFDTDEFWKVMRGWAKHNTVFISEYSCPPDFLPVLAFKKKSTLAGGDRQTERTEMVFMHQTTHDRILTRVMLGKIT